MTASFLRHGGLFALAPFVAAIAVAILMLSASPPAEAGDERPVSVTGKVLAKTTIHQPYTTETNGRRIQQMQESYILTLALPARDGRLTQKMDQQVNLDAFYDLRTEDPVNITLDPVSLRIIDIKPGYAPDPARSGRMIGLGIVLLGLMASFIVWLRITRTPHAT